MSSVSELVGDGRCAQLQQVVDCAGGRFVCFTRCTAAAWSISVTDGVDVWIWQAGQTELDAHRDVAELSSFEAYFSRFRTAFLAGEVSISGTGHRLQCTLGKGSSTLTYDLYEATASERKEDLKHILFRLADKVTELDQKLSDSTVRLDALRQNHPERQVGGKGGAGFDLDMQRNRGPAAKVRRKEGYSILNPESKRVKAPRGVHFDDEEDSS
uniref:PAXX non-homologous end joining factor n=1 Tax=Branchiostoma floridae TaxID=7739 RepID=C3XXK2_BRAFL|eukprot:XP_002611452.1 hypothetical protein BRAFLDRAFT_63916 [Branchiostoma floridae]